MSDSLLMLLEMVEEVLEEQNLSEAFNIPIFNVEDIENIEDETRKQEVSRLFDFLVEKGVLYPLAYEPETKRVKIRNVPKKYQKQIRDELRDIGIKRFSFGQGSTSRGGKKISRESEKFEGNLIIALNGSKPKGFTYKDYVETQEHQDRANRVIASIGRNNIEGNDFYKVKNGVVSNVYTKYGVSNSTSKADITSKAVADTRISVKKENASLLSAENNETRAIFYAISDKEPKVEKFLNTLGQKLSKQLWNSLNTKQRRELGDEVIEMIEKFIGQSLSSDSDFKKHYLFEAMSGKHRFEGEMQKANKLLIWDVGGNGSYYELSDWCIQNSQKIKFDIRWRGRGRSGGKRIGKINEFRDTRREFSRIIEMILKDTDESPDFGLDIRVSNIPAYAFMEET
jgi:hypothetical protein